MIILLISNTCRDDSSILIFFFILCNIDDILPAQIVNEVEREVDENKKLTFYFYFILFHIILFYF